jgi:hypothetical protein
MDQYHVVALLEGGGTDNPGVAARNAHRLLTELAFKNPGVARWPTCPSGNFSAPGEEGAELQRLIRWASSGLGVKSPAKTSVRPSEGPQRGRGRPSDTNHADDERMYKEWATGKYRTYAGLAAALGKECRQVSLAIDRHRQRLTRQAQRRTKLR